MQPKTRKRKTLTAIRPQSGVERGLEIISVLSSATKPLSLTEISNITRMDPSGVHRMMKSLIKAGYAIRNSGNRRYIPGPKTLFPLSLYHPINVARRDAVALMQSLREETGLTIGLMFFLGTERLVVELIQGRDYMAPFYESHLTRPIHPSASGKILLMTLDEEKRDELLGPTPYEALTSETIVDRATLFTCLLEVEAKGYAVARDEMHIGLTGIASPIILFDSILGCLTAFGLTQNLPANRIPQLGQRLKDTATLFSNTSNSVRVIYELCNAGGVQSQQKT